VDTYTAKERKSHARRLRKELPAKIKGYESKFVAKDYTDEQFRIANEEFYDFIFMAWEYTDIGKKHLTGHIRNAQNERWAENGEFFDQDLLLAKLLKYLEPDACPLLFCLLYRDTRFWTNGNQMDDLWRLIEQWSE